MTQSNSRLVNCATKSLQKRIVIWIGSLTLIQCTEKRAWNSNDAHVGAVHVLGPNMGGVGIDSPTSASFKNLG